MDCARCGNSLHKVPMFDLPRRVKEYACLCCGERFWTVEGTVKLFKDESSAREVLKQELKLEFSATRKN